MLTLYPTPKNWVGENPSKNDSINDKTGQKINLFPVPQAGKKISIGCPEKHLFFTYYLHRFL